VSESPDQPERPPTATFMEALGVKRNAMIGLISGVAFAVAVYLFFVVFAPGTTQNTPYYLALWFTLATATAGSVAVVLTVWSAITLARDLE